MHTLLSLPPEVHLLIIGETDFYDLESLWTSCPQFYAYGKEKLQMHRHRKAKFHTIIVGWDNDSPTQIHPLLDLRDILEDEGSRFYPRVMEINSLEYGDPEDDEVDDDGEYSHRDRKAEEIDSIVEKYGDRITSMVTEIHRKLLPDAPAAEAAVWDNQIQSGDPAATVILLLALYTELETIHIHESAQQWWDTGYGALFTSFIAAATDPVTNTLGIFSKLSEFTLNGDTYLLEVPSRAELFSHFMAVPTMRSIEAYYVEGRNVQWPWGTGYSQVTDIKLEACDIDTNTLINHIGAVQKLETFTYTFSPESDMTDDTDEDEIYTQPTSPIFRISGGDDSDLDSPRWEPGAIVAYLQLHACDTLVFLELAARQLKGSVPFQDDEPYIGNLRAFKTLQEVKLDTMMLYERVKLSASMPLESGQEFPQGHFEEARAQRLVEFLPASIQRFHMTSKDVGRGPSREDVGAMFKGLPELRGRCLPNLEEICVEYAENGDAVEKEGRRELRLRCRKAGIELESIKWKRERGGSSPSIRQVTWMA